MEGQLNGNFDSGKKVSALEQRYIQLLERRIADLEAQIDKREPQNRLVTAGIGVAEVTTSKPAIEETVLKEETKNEIQKSADSAGGEKLDSTSGPSLIKTETPRYKIVLSKFDPDTLERIEGPVDQDQKDVKPVVEERQEIDVAFTYRKLVMPRSRYTYRDELGVFMSCEVEIHSKPLQQLVSKMLSKYVGKKEIVELKAETTDFKALIWSWDEAMVESTNEKHEEGAEGTQARKDLHELMKTISTSSGVDHLQQYFKQRNVHQRDGTITFDHLWTLFPPGAEILGRPFMDQPQVFFVHSCEGWEKSLTRESNKCKIKCYGLDWNGKEFNRVPFEVVIDYYKEAKSIIELPYFPLHCYVDDKDDSGVAIEKLKAKLTERGTHYRKLCIAGKGQQMFTYEGHALNHQFGKGILQTPTDELDLDSLSELSGSRISDRSLNESSRNRLLVKGVAMVDFVSYFEYQSADKAFMGSLRRFPGDMECTCPVCRNDHSLKRIYRPDWDHIDRDVELTKDQYLFCPPRVLGYAMAQKQWVQFDVLRLKKPQRADVDVFKKELQLNEDHKDLILNSVLAHEAGKKKDRHGKSRGVDDFAEGKGKGLIILLYGLPGVGKTLTAESVALLAGKPLFSVGVSEIGIEGARVEVNLQKIFDLASLWEAVLLFDEADVFLEARGSGENDLRRNAMVSVLLRVLEYYEGILILTTNRLKSFDIAVQSRIRELTTSNTPCGIRKLIQGSDLAIRYDDLSREQRQNIFLAFLEQLQKKQLCSNFNGRGGIREWVEKEGGRYTFNGRQIRNVVSAALGMARAPREERAETGKLTADDLREVARQTEEFQKDLYAQAVIFRKEQMSQN